MSRLGLDQMRERRWGRIINVLAIAAKAPGARSAPSSVSRAAGMALTKVMSAEGAPHNILVNALLVGQIESDQMARGFKARGGDATYEQFLAQAGARVPLGRIGKAEEFAATACFLASEQGGYLTGVAIQMSMVVGRRRSARNSPPEAKAPPAEGHRRRRRPGCKGGVLRTSFGQGHWASGRGRPSGPGLQGKRPDESTDR